MIRVDNGSEMSDSNVRIRLIDPSDDTALARVIREVMSDFGATGEGTSFHDAEIDAMYDAYQDRAAYFVLIDGDRLIGGGGIGPLVGDDGTTCELRKMYFLPEARGRGFGRAMLEKCIAAAREHGYRFCYLETMDSMKEARRLYEAAGFGRTDKPSGDTGHHGCDAWLRLEL